MNTYSRRDFLKMTGISIVASQIPLLRYFPPSVLEAALQGRALTAAPIYQAPDRNSNIIGTLWPDSVSGIHATDDNWYRIANGYVERGEIQPMFPSDQPQDFQVPTIPFWAEVIGPVATVRLYCAENAPLVTRIGHGGVTQVIDYLPGESHGWYGLGDDQNLLLGWTQALQWTPVIETPASGSDSIIGVELSSQTLSVIQNGAILLQSRCSVSPGIKPDTYYLERLKPGGSFTFHESTDTFHGAPWQLSLGTGEKLMGAYWHNQFGTGLHGPAIQVPPLVARWLYNSTNAGDRLIVA